MKKFEQSMRWFGPTDPVSLPDIRQAGCTEVVTALHHIPVGDIWTKEEIRKRKVMIEEHGLKWRVIESLPVHEDIKKKSGDYELYTRNYVESIRNLRGFGIEVITYNFMPILDWMRTDPSFTLPNGSKALKFEKAAFIAFDLFLLKRPGAESDYSEGEIAEATRRFEAMGTAEKEYLYKSTLLGLPGSDVPFTPGEILTALKTYEDIDAQMLKGNLKHFLQEVVPVAEECGLRMAVHPDDPPYPILGLPRVVSTAADLHEICGFVDLPANGICYCTGSLGVREDNDLVGIIRELGERIHFVHLRSTERSANGDFFEADHLYGDVDMYAVMKELLMLMSRTGRSLTMRPDHGHQMLDDLNKVTYPGYSAVGRLKGLAELRGLEEGILRNFFS